jgi:hypothetical protein
LISACPKAGYYAVLASLSRRYPPLEGRSPTCYSPVCHSTCGRSRFRVRLACVRHAASVDSEPGSNSHVKIVGVSACPLSPGFRQPRRNLPTRTTRSTRDLFGSAALFRICQVLRLRPGPHEPGHPQADTRRVFVCACTHYLVFKEPTASPPISRRVPEQPSVREPFDVTAAGSVCQPPISWRLTFPSAPPQAAVAWGTLREYQHPRPLVNTYLRPCAFISGCLGTWAASSAATRVRGRQTEYAEAPPLSNQAGTAQNLAIL